MKKSAFTILLSLLIFAQLFAGHVITSIQMQDGMEMQYKTYIQGDKLRFDDPEQNIGFIIDFEKKEMTILALSQNKFYTATMDDFQHAMRQAGYQQMEEMLQQFPEEQRAMMKQRIDQMKQEMQKPYSGQLHIVSSGESETLAGYSGKHYNVLENGAKVEEVWYTDELNLGIVKKMSEMLMAMGAPAMYETSEKYLDHFGEGIILRSIDENGDLTETIDISEENIPDSYFQTPNGFQEMNIEQVSELLMSGEEEEDY